MRCAFKKKYSPDLFSWEELSELINMTPLMLDKRVNILNKSRDFSLNNDDWDFCECFPAVEIKDALIDHVVYLTGMSRSTKKINDFADMIETEYESPADAHIYICKNMNIEHPFGIHYDLSHNVIVQCEGRTNFKVWNELEDKNVPRCNLPITEIPILNVDMEPGDAIFIPAYYPHLATSITDRMSVSFPFSPHNDFTLQNREWIQI